MLEIMEYIVINYALGMIDNEYVLVFYIL